ncbi:MAG: EamA family transporter [Alphaproteobacteria bacterium]|nr:EamA family transporter [Alphaproteobacteria bacterium]
MSSKLSFFHFITLLSVSLVWGANFAVAKIGMINFPPIAFLTLRFIGVAFVLIPFTRIPREYFLKIFFLSFTLCLIHFGFLYAGIKQLDVATSSIVVQLQVPIAALLSKFYFKENLTLKNILGMLLAFLGIGIIVGEPKLQGNILPIIFVIIAATAWAFSNIQMKDIGQHVDPMTLNCWIAAFASPQLALASFFFEHNQLNAILQSDYKLWLALIYQILFATLLGYGLWYSMIKIYSVNKVMPFTFLIPFFSVLSGIIFLNEKLTLNIILGAICILTGIALIIFYSHKVNTVQ